MKRVWLPMMLSAVSLAACGGQGAEQPASTTSKAQPTETVEAEEIRFTQDNVSELAAATETDEVEGATIEEITGKVFDVQREADVVAVQMYTDPENQEGNVIVGLESDADVREDDFITVSGTGVDVFEGTNGFGAELQIPRIEASEWERVDASVLSPAEKTYRPAQTRDLGGVSITVRKVELAESETRVFVRMRNNSREDFYTSPDALTAGGEEVEEVSNDDYKAPADDLSPGASTKGVIVFEAVDPDDPLRITWEGYDANYDDIKTTFEYGD